MRIGIVGPATLSMLQHHLAKQHQLPAGHDFPQNSLLINQLIESGHRVSLFTLSRYVLQPTTFDGDALRVHIGRYRPRHRARDLFRREIDDLLFLLGSDPCQAYSAHWLYEFAQAVIRAKVPSLITVHDWPPEILLHNPSLYRAARLLIGCVTLSSRKSNWVAVSPYIEARLRSVGKKRVQVIPNGVEATGLLPEPLPLSRRANRIVAVANGFSAHKNMKVLLKAAPLIRASNPDFQLELIGDGFDENGEAARWARDQKLESGIVFRGPLPYAVAQDYLASARLLVHPSLEESFGRVLVEAMAKGTPVIAGLKSGAVPWVLGEGRAGRLVNVRSPAEIANAVTDLLADQQDWNRLSLAGAQEVRERFLLAEIAKQYVAALDQIA